MILTGSLLGVIFAIKYFKDVKKNQFKEEMKSILFDSVDERLDILRKIFGIDRYKRIIENSTIISRELKSIRRVGLRQPVAVIPNGVQVEPIGEWVEHEVKTILFLSFMCRFIKDLSEYRLSQLSRVLLKKDFIAFLLFDLLFSFCILV